MNENIWMDELLDFKTIWCGLTSAQFQLEINDRVSISASTPGPCLILPHEPESIKLPERHAMPVSYLARVCPPRLAYDIASDLRLISKGLGIDTRNLHQAFMDPYFSNLI